jgi:hypothetical protein|tara:strand:+ start:129 stop:365 length:237 start_codon:yes stop_codon:yes gene_type:complete
MPRFRTKKNSEEEQQILSQIQSLIDHQKQQRNAINFKIDRTRGRNKSSFTNYQVQESFKQQQAILEKLPSIKEIRFKS